MTGERARLNAVLAILGDQKNSRPSTTSAKRVAAAARVLGFTDDEVRLLMVWMEYADYDTGEPYNAKVKRVWP